MSQEKKTFDFCRSPENQAIPFVINPFLKNVSCRASYSLSHAQSNNGSPYLARVSRPLVQFNYWSNQYAHMRVYESDGGEVDNSLNYTVCVQFAEGGGVWFQITNHGFILSSDHVFGWTMNHRLSLKAITDHDYIFVSPITDHGLFLTPITDHDKPLYHPVCRRVKWDP